MQRPASRPRSHHPIVAHRARLPHGRIGPLAGPGGCRRGCRDHGRRRRPRPRPGASLGERPLQLVDAIEVPRCVLRERLRPPGDPHGRGSAVDPELAFEVGHDGRERGRRRRGGRRARRPSGRPRPGGRPGRRAPVGPLGRCPRRGSEVCAARASARGGRCRPARARRPPRRSAERHHDDRARSRCRPGGLRRPGETRAPAAAPRRRRGSARSTASTLTPFTSQRPVGRSLERLDGLAEQPPGRRRAQRPRRSTRASIPLGGARKTGPADRSAHLAARLRRPSSRLREPRRPFGDLWGGRRQAELRRVAGVDAADERVDEPIEHLRAEAVRDQGTEVVGVRDDRAGTSGSSSRPRLARPAEQVGPGQ